MNPIEAILLELRTLIVKALATASQALTAASAVPSIQHGSATLVAGITPPIVANITATSSIVVTLNAIGGANAGLTVEYGALTRAVGSPGAFQIGALTAGYVINALDASTLDWVIVG